MKTIAITVDRSTLDLLEELAERLAGSRSALIRKAVFEFAERTRRQSREADEAAILHRHRRRLGREARALVREQARK